MRKALIWVLGTVATALVVWGILHVMIVPVNPAQTPPEDHYGDGCSMCHIVTEGAEIIE